jgi:L-aspartate oxidase
MSRSAGLMRHLEELQEAARALLALVSGHTAASDPAAVGLMIVVMALRREESRGAHSRTDFPQRDAVARRATLGFVDAIAAAREIGRHTSSTASRAQA